MMILNVIYYLPGLIIYFCYGIHNSSENVSLVEQEKDQGSGFLTYTNLQGERKSPLTQPQPIADAAALNPSPQQQQVSSGYDNRAMELDEAYMQP